MRVKLWIELACQPRTLIIFIKILHHGGLPLQSRSGERIERTGGYFCSAPIPITLCINHESRAESMKSLRILLGTYINPDFDTIILSSSLCRMILTESTTNEQGSLETIGKRQKLFDDLKMIKHIGLLNETGNYSWDKKTKESFRRMILSCFPALETITFVLSRFRYNWTMDESPRGLLLDDLLDTDNKTIDPFGFSERKRLIKAVEEDYQLGWEMTRDIYGDKDHKVALQAQKDRLGGKAPAVYVRRYAPATPHPVGVHLYCDGPNEAGSSDEMGYIVGSSCLPRVELNCGNKSDN